ncbi:hypothetical protein ACX27_08535 [Nostoc piscinale CENA21]|uniref:LysM domain-containing protein n=1 Tax=Nostoc piscinale CENA21 TaxID=224013 RepID=A0A0M3V4X5_9NOSO|nr:hypothetical protein [Nostoc piscinale]ALF52893.1 hypothetical protein ACX27_08535 [Nostoc piscinale CENA21]
MFELNSRYYTLEIVNKNTKDGRQIPYVRRRFLPDADLMPTLTEVTVTAGDRLDLIAARTLGNPEEYWRVCDTNYAMNPNDLTAQIGRRLRIGLPQSF